METTAYQSPLQDLEQQLEIALSEPDTAAEGLRIRCAVRQGTLMILGEHPAYAIADPSRVLDDLEQAVRHLSPTLVVASLQAESVSEAVERPAEHIIPVQLYLRVDSQPRPYRTRRFWWDVHHAAEAASPEAALEDELDLDSIPEFQPTAPPEDALEDMDPIGGEPAGFESEVDEEVSADPGDADAEEGEAETDLLSDERATSSLAIAPNSRNDLVPEEPFVGNLELEKPTVRPRYRRPNRPIETWAGLIAGSVIAGVVFSTTLYVLTRPCVVGGCQRLAQAAALSQGAIERLEQIPSATAVLQSHAELQEAYQRLAAIPPWSPHHKAAQSILQTYQRQIEELDQVVLAQQQAMTAAEKSQNPPHPEDHWVEVQQFWQQAIAGLEQLPPDSSVYAYAQQKLGEYRANLAAINHRIAAEQDAERALNASLTAAQKAEALSNAADSFSSWQFAFADWQQAVNQLKRIPQGTMAYQEAQRLLPSYQEKLTLAQNRRTQEQAGLEVYNRALQLADQARTFEQQNQWTLAIRSWQNALSTMQQVPKGTAHADESQTLLLSFQEALNRAQNNLQLAMARQQTEAELKQTCAGTPTICTYTVTPSLIQVRLTPDYDRSVQQAMMNATLQQDNASQVQITQHVNTLLRALTTIGDNASIPVELYDANGVLLGRYVPGTNYAQ